MTPEALKTMNDKSVFGECLASGSVGVVAWEVRERVHRDGPRPGWYRLTLVVPWVPKLSSLYEDDEDCEWHSVPLDVFYPKGESEGVVGHFFEGSLEAAKETAIAWATRCADQKEKEKDSP